jgi:molybdopterin converting factor subunit 1
MKVLFFAQSREAAGCSEGAIDLMKPVTQAELWSLLIGKYPGLSAQRKTARLARRETYLQEDELIHPDDEIALIPPVSGG